MNNELLEQLLNEEESSSLDFKRDQYPFEGATDEKKSELLKDIIAFTNAWRRTDAYILIGVEEVRGGKSKGVGVHEHLDDAKLQQFVNSKTQRPIPFSYEAYPFEGVQIGIVTIPVQERPAFLQKDYGKLKKNVVYLRRGSSTDEADPDEIARMGAATVQAVQTEPIIGLQFADLKKRREIGSEISIKSTIFYPRLDPEIFKPSPQSYGATRLANLANGTQFGTNSDYYEELIEYVADSALLTPVGFMIENKSSQVALGVELRATVAVQKGIYLIDEADAPVRPVKNRLVVAQISPFHSALVKRPEPQVTHYGDHWELKIDFGKVLPRSKVWSTGVVSIGGDNSQTVQIDAALYAENLSNPMKVPLVVRIHAESRPMERRDLEPLMST
jgi:hypothetical protein